MPGPIEHVVIIVKENHTFDCYFGKYPGADGDPTLAPAASPPDVDPSHDHTTWLNRATKAVREQYGQADIPGYWAYASQFTLCDRYFTDVAGPSTPNHLMLITGDSPVINNPPGGYRTGPAQTQYDLPSLPAQLETAGLTWGNYGGYAFAFVKALGDRNKHDSTQFVTDAQSGTLPTVSWVYADHAHSEHPPDTAADRAAGVGNVGAGMAWTVAQVEAIVAGGLWGKTAIFLTWDDWGGWADHVDPPAVETWTDGSQFRYGSRVPCLVLSPFAKAAYISKTLHSHVSLIRFCEATFGLPSVNARTAAADDMSDCFDYSRQLPVPNAAGGVTPPPPPLTSTPLTATERLTSIRDSAARAKARIAELQKVVTDSHALEQLRYASMDVDTITQLTTPSQESP
jgi:phospholipase C